MIPYGLSTSTLSKDVAHRDAGDHHGSDKAVRTEAAPFTTVATSLERSDNERNNTDEIKSVRKHI